MASNVLILGAGIYQVPLIKRIQARGMRAVVASIPGDYPGISLADEFLPVNTTDERGIVEAARNIDAKAVITTGTDVALRSLGATVDALGLVGPTHVMAFRATNKADMKQAFEEGGVRSAKHVKAASESDALSAWTSLHPHANSHPLMVKCPDRSGSRGISIATSPDGVLDAFHDAVDASLCGYAVIEDYIEGHEVGLDGYVNADGQVSFLAYHDKIVRSNSHTDVPVGHRMDADFIQYCRTETDLAEQAQRTATAVGMRRCFFNMDVILDTENRAWVIEAGVRAGATCIPEVIGTYYGFDYYEAMIDAALGQEPTFPAEPVCGASEGRLLLSDSEAIAQCAAIEDMLRPVKAQYEVSIEASVDYAAGERLPAFENGTSRIGQIVCSGPDSHTVAMAIVSAQKELEAEYIGA